jgi:hypothetical protein
MRNSSESSIEPARDSHLFFLSRQFLCQCRNAFRNRSDRIGVHGIGVFSIKLRVREAALLQRIVQPVYANLKGVKLRAHRLGIVVLRIGRLAIKHIRDHWYEILRLATSIKQGTVTASLMQRKLGSYPRQNGLALALRELGRSERSLFVLDWLQSVELRRRVNAGLNQGEARNALPGAVFFNRLGEIRDRSFEQQRYRASGLNLDNLASTVKTIAAGVCHLYDLTDRVLARLMRSSSGRGAFFLRPAHAIKDDTIARVTEGIACCQNFCRKHLPGK